MPAPLAPEPQTLGEIRDWHSGMVEALVVHVAAVRRAIRESRPVAPRFVGLAEGDLDAYYEAQRRELNRLTVLNLVAGAEADLRRDFFRRVRKGKRRDPLAKVYRRWYKTLSKKKKKRPDFDEAGILSRLKEADVLGTGGKHLIGQFRECLRSRNWVAHGRYWAKPVEVDTLDPDEVYRRTDQLLKVLPP